MPIRPRGNPVIFDFRRARGLRRFVLLFLLPSFFLRTAAVGQALVP